MPRTHQPQGFGRRRDCARDPGGRAGQREQDKEVTDGPEEASCERTFIGAWEHPFFDELP